MNRRGAKFPTASSLTILSRLLLQPTDDDGRGSPAAIEQDKAALKLSRDEFEDVLALANLNHVVVRGLERFLSLAGEQQNLPWFELATNALSSEKARIRTALFASE